MAAHECGTVVQDKGRGVNKMADIKPNTKVYTTYGPTSAKPITPVVAAKMLNKAKRPLLVVGSKITKDNLLDKAIALHEAGIPVVATGSAIKAFVDRGVNVAYMNLNAIITYLNDPEWKGLDGEGTYDTVAFLGHIQYYIAQQHSTLKNFSDITTISLEGFYAQNASMSFGHMKEEQHEKYLDEVIANISRK